MITLICNIILAVVWTLMFEEFTFANLFVGFVVGYVILRITLGRKPEHRGYFSRVWRGVRLLVYFLAELVIANIRMAWWTCGPLRPLRPMIIAVPLAEDMSDVEITILANMVTLTPGTLSLDVSANRDVLFVHFMHVSDPAAEVRSIKQGFERRLLEVTR